MDICLDARVRGCWDLDYYLKHHMIGGCAPPPSLPPIYYHIWKVKPPQTRVRLLRYDLPHHLIGGYAPYRGTSLRRNSLQEYLAHEKHPPT